MDLALGLAQASLGYLLGGLGGCLILFARDLGVARGSLAWLSAGFGAALLLLGFAGACLLRLGAGRVVRGSTVILALGAALLATGASVPLGQAGALLLGLGGAGIVLACPVLITGPEAAARLTLVNAFSSVASVCAPLTLSFTEALTGHGRLALLLPAPGLLWLASRPSLSSAPVAAPGPASAGPARTLGPIALAGAWLSVVFAVAPEFAFVVWGAARLQDSGLAPATATAAAAAFPVGMAAGRIVAPRFLRRVPAVPLGVGLAVAGALTASAPAHPALLAVAVGAAGLGISTLYPVTLARLMATPGLGLRRGAALGVAASGVAVLAAPILLNAIAGHTSLRAAFLAVIPSLLLVVALERRRRPAERARRRPAEETGGSE